MAVATIAWEQRRVVTAWTRFCRASLSHPDKPRRDMATLQRVE